MQAPTRRRCPPCPSRKPLLPVRAESSLRWFHIQTGIFGQRGIAQAAPKAPVMTAQPPDLTAELWPPTDDSHTMHFGLTAADMVQLQSRTAEQTFPLQPSVRFATRDASPIWADAESGSGAAIGNPAALGPVNVPVAPVTKVEQDAWAELQTPDSGETMVTPAMTELEEMTMQSQAKFNPAAQAPVPGSEEAYVASASAGIKDQQVIFRPPLARPCLVPAIRARFSHAHCSWNDACGDARDCAGFFNYGVTAALDHTDQCACVQCKCVWRVCTGDRRCSCNHSGQHGEHTARDDISACTRTSARADSSGCERRQSQRPTCRTAWRRRQWRGIAECRRRWQSARCI